MTINLTWGPVTANRSVLNSISIAFMEAAERYERMGAHALAKDAKENNDRIYNALEKSGYYK